MRQPRARADAGVVAPVNGDATVPSGEVRVCPVCERDNPPERARCLCGATLAGVDFTLRTVPVAVAAVGDDATPVPAADSRASATIACPHADCAQPNPPGGTRCLYCNRPLDPRAGVPGNRVLPAVLRERYRVIEAFPATGSEADLLLVADAATAERAVAKIYRHGIAPDFRLLDLLSRTVGDSVVRVLGHGSADGVAYELLEYVPGGTLADLLQAGPLPKADIRRVVAEVAEALAGIHAQRILHRDLKPENILVRSTSPLSLALTDFGIASLSAATQHFTTAARTTKYAAPEALTGVLDAKSDWWSLGMIVLEAASGRHPFDGLNEQVMSHHLATRPIDVRDVVDDDLRLLCRGLLLREPARRFGAAEVDRWLAGDATLAVDADAVGVATVVRPYRIGAADATSRTELAAVLARNWDAARRDLARGQVARWLEHELHDYDLVRALRDAQDLRGVSEDARLLRLLLAAAPDLPPVWRGAAAGLEAVQVFAAAAAAGDEVARDWLDSLYRDQALAAYADIGNAALGELDRRWRSGWSRYVELCDAARRAEQKWRAQPRDVGGGADNAAVSFDDLAFVASGKLAPPPQRAVNGPLLLALEGGDDLAGLRADVQAAHARIAGLCPWFDVFWEAVADDPVGVVVARHVAACAEDDAALERRRRAAAAAAQARRAAEALGALRTEVETVLAIVPPGDDELDRADLETLSAAFDRLQAGCRNLESVDLADPAFEPARRAAERVSLQAFAVQQALAEAQSVHGVNAIFVAPQRLLAAAAFAVFVLLLRVPALIVTVLGLAVVVAGYRWYAGYRATENVLAKLKQFGLGARTFLRTAGGDGSGRGEAS